MKKTISSLLLSAILLCAAFLVTKHISANPQSMSMEAQYVPNEVLIKFRENITDVASLRTVNSLVQGKVVNYLKQEINSADWDFENRNTRSFLSFPKLLRLRVPEGIGTDQAISILRNSAFVEYAERNGIVHATTTPNDSHWSKLWGLYNTGQSGGTSRADIHAPEAWDIITGSPDVVVAVIDSGIDYNHTELANNIWINSGE